MATVLIVLKEIVATVFCVIVCIVWLKIIVRAWLSFTKTDDDFEASEILHSVTLRPLRPHEMYFHQSYRHNIFALFLESSCQLKPEIVKQALKKASQKHILLRCRLRTLENDGKKSFVFARSTFEEAIDFQDVSLENWEDIMEAMSVGGAHLWSAKFVQLTSLPKSSKTNLSFYCGECSYVLLLALHPSVADGVSTLHFCNSIMKSINTLFVGNEIISHDTIKMFPDDFLPGELENIGTWPVILKNVSKTILGKLQDLAQNPRLRKIQRTMSVTDHYQQQRSRIVLLEFPRTKLDLLRHKCHIHGSTMHGALSAIAALALTQSCVEGADDGILGGKIGSSITSQYFVNFRKSCKHEVSGDVMACLTCPFTIKMAEHDEFWHIARIMTVEIHDKHQERKHLRELQQNMIYNNLFYCKNELLNRILNNYRRPKPLQYCDFAISDLNEHDVIYSHDTDKVFLDKIACVVGFGGNCNFVHSTMTLHGRLFWSLGYNTSVVSRQMAEVYGRKIKEVFEEAITERK